MSPHWPGNTAPRAAACLVALLAASVSAFCQQPAADGAQEFRRRLAALASTVASEELTGAEKGATIISALRSELRAPVDRLGTAVLSSGYSLSEQLRIGYVSALGEVADPDLVWHEMARVPTGEEADSMDRALRKLLLFSFAASVSHHQGASGGAARRGPVTSQLIRLLHNDEYDFMRALAARSLGLVGASEAKPALAQALSDLAFRDVAGLTDIQAPGWGTKQYLVRLEAALALQRMGFTIRHPSHDVWLLAE